MCTSREAGNKMGPLAISQAKPYDVTLKKGRGRANVLPCVAANDFELREIVKPLREPTPGYLHDLVRKKSMRFSP